LQNEIVEKIKFFSLKESFMQVTVQYQQPYYRDVIPSTLLVHAYKKNFKIHIKSKNSHCFDLKEQKISFLKIGLTITSSVIFV
jgi:hypothetical protein